MEGAGRPQPRQMQHYYLAPLAQLVFNPGRWVWCNGDPLYNYTATKGRLLLNPRIQLTRRNGLA